MFFHSRSHFVVCFHHPGVGVKNNNFAVVLPLNMVSMVDYGAGRTIETDLSVFVHLCPNTASSIDIATQHNVSITMHASQYSVLTVGLKASSETLRLSECVRLGQMV